MSTDDPGTPGAPGEPPDGGDSRRRFLQLATCAVGGGLGAAVLIPAARLLAHPLGRSIVSASSEPIDAVAVKDVGVEPLRVPLVARRVADAWAATTNVVLGAAWLRRTPDGSIAAYSAECPHKGCAVGYTPAAKRFECPCHSATFDIDGKRLSGPAERGLDPLDLTVVDGRIKISFVRYQNGGAERKKV
ncbi:MAG: ubiquinol-cytochrome c reductase iron-sulfur subunit [Kofleriaceae bacterium]